MRKEKKPEKRFQEIDGGAFVVHILIFKNISWKYAFNQISTEMSHGSSSYFDILFFES